MKKPSKKNATPAPAAPPVIPPTRDITIEGCSFTGNAAANEHTRAAIEAIANAAGKNADALKAAADALNPKGMGMQNGVYVSGSGF